MWVQVIQMAFLNGYFRQVDRELRVYRKKKMKLASDGILINYCCRSGAILITAPLLSSASTINYHVELIDSRQ